MHKFKIDPSFFVLFIFVLLSPKQIYLLQIIGALFLHELGHLLFIYLFKIKIVSIKLYAFGFMMELEPHTSIWYQDLFVYGGGLLFNLFGFIACPWKVFKYINIGLIILNILPIYPLDGFRLLRTVVEFFFSYYYSFLILFSISICSLIVVFIFLHVKNCDLLILFNLLYLAYLNYELYKNRKMNFYKFLLQKQLDSRTGPTRSCKFHEGFSHYIFRYHLIEMKIGNKVIPEKVLLDSFFHSKMKINLKI